MLSEIISCKNCDLHKNQLPLIDKKQDASIMWVGLSAKKVEDSHKETPLSVNTNSGLLVNRMEVLCPGFTFYKTNLVKCAPLTPEGKLRYPTKMEMKLCFNNLTQEISTIKPKIVFLLGKEVSNFVLTKIGKKLSKYDDNFKYVVFEDMQTYYIPIHHPSFMQVYRRKDIDGYILGVVALIKEISSKDKEAINNGLPRFPAM